MSKYYRFMHTSYMNFKVGRFEFKDHKLRVEEADLPDFLETVKGLHESDRLGIRKIADEEESTDLETFAADLKTATEDEAKKAEDSSDENKSAVIPGVAGTDRLNRPVIGGVLQPNQGAVAQTIKIT